MKFLLMVGVKPNALPTAEMIRMDLPQFDGHSETRKSKRGRSERWRRTESVSGGGFRQRLVFYPQPARSPRHRAPVREEVRSPF
jgi:hypothetical protein